MAGLTARICVQAVNFAGGLSAVVGIGEAGDETRVGEGNGGSIVNILQAIADPNSSLYLVPTHCWQTMTTTGLPPHRHGGGTQCTGRGGLPASGFDTALFLDRPPIREISHGGSGGSL